MFTVRIIPGSEIQDASLLIANADGIYIYIYNYRSALNG
jgi:hypothetical protein